MTDGDDPGLSGAPRNRSSVVSRVRHSTVKLPEHAPFAAATVFEFFLHRFPRISRATWQERFAAGRVWTADGRLDTETPYRPLLEVHYRREVEGEPPVREDFRVVWSDRHLMVVDKPPNLPVTPGGRWVRGCLLHLLSEATGIEDLAPLHRIDRLTSGLVLWSLDRSTRSHYGRLFQPRPLIEKTYHAVCELRCAPPPSRFTLVHRITRSAEEYWRQVAVADGVGNARCEVEVLAVEDGLLLVRVKPQTGRKHQIRVQLAVAGLPILGDPLYGTRPSHDPEDLTQRLWLDAWRLEVSAFPGAAGEGELDGCWTSSRSPSDFFARAGDWRRGR